MIFEKQKVDGIGWDLLLRLTYRSVFIIYSH